MLLRNATLKSLCVGDGTLGDDGVVALARGIAGGSLTRLDLGGKGLSARGAEALSAALTTATALSHLVLTSNSKLGDAGLQALCQVGGTNTLSCDDQAAAGCPTPPPPLSTPRWAGLRVLELQGCGITAVGVAALAMSPNSERLEVLRLDGNPLGVAGGRALRILLQRATSLHEVFLRGTELGDEGGEEVATGLAPGAGAPDTGEGAAASGLSLLDLSDCGLGSRATAAFGGGGARLHTLNLAGNQHVRDADAAALGERLAAGGSAELLTHLDLSGTQAGPGAVEALSEAAGLRHLSLVGCPLGSEGAKALARSLLDDRWAGLRELCISGTGIDKEDMAGIFERLAAGSALNLKSIEIGANPATQVDDFPDLLEKLRACRPGVAVYWRSGDDPAPVME